MSYVLRELLALCNFVYIFLGVSLPLKLKKYERKKEELREI